MDWEKMRFLEDAQIQAAWKRSATSARQNKPFILIIAFISCVLFLFSMPWSGGSNGKYGPPSMPYMKGGRHNPNYTPDADPAFNQTLSEARGSLEIIPPNTLGKRARWAKVAVASGFEDVVYERALQTHIRHAERHGYPMYVGRENAADGMFNKIAFILNIVLQELYKPAEDRIGWVL